MRNLQKGLVAGRGAARHTNTTRNAIGCHTLAIILSRLSTILQIFCILFLAIRFKIHCSENLVSCCILVLHSSVDGSFLSNLISPKTEFFTVKCLLPKVNES